MATELGHLDQEQKNRKSTTNDNEKISDHHNESGTYISIVTFKKHDILFSPQNKLYRDQTDRFPHTSSRGNQYILVMYDYDYNAIVVEPMKRRQGLQLAKSFKTCCEKLKLHQRLTKLCILDSKCPKEMQATINIYDGTYQLVPLHQHRRNAAETAIRTFKNHF